MADDPLQCSIGPVVPIWAGQGHISQGRGSEPIGIVKPIRDSHVPDIAHNGIPLPGPAGAEVGQHQCIEPLVGQKRPGMATDAPRLAVEKLEPCLLGLVESVGIPRQITIEPAVETLVFADVYFVLS